MGSVNRWRSRLGANLWNHGLMPSATERQPELCLAKLKPLKLAEYLTALEPSDVECSSDRVRSISSSRVRGLIGKDAFVAVAAHEPDEKPNADEQVKGFLDAISWQLEKAPSGRARYFIGRSAKTTQVLQALATLNKALPERRRVLITVDDEPQDPELPNFENEKPRWHKKLTDRDALLDKPPSLVSELERRVGDPAFRWHLTVSANAWSGRLGGLQICSVDRQGTKGTLSVGKRGSDHKAAQRFRELTNEELVEFDLSTVDNAADVIRDFARSRASLGDPEHRLEATILSRDVVLRTAAGDPLEPAIEVSQFPAVWWEDDKANRYTDLLMHVEDVPWIVELKVDSQGQGQYYRHAVGQVVLYREFIRNARSLRPWFLNRATPLDASKCRAAVVFPAIRGSRAARFLKDVETLGRFFGVDIITIEAPFESKVDEGVGHA